MAEPELMTKTIKASEARQHFSQLLNEVFRRESRVVVEKSGIPVAAIISAEDFKRLARLEQERASTLKPWMRSAKPSRMFPPRRLSGK
jgi:prevent-host-death family protein